jgi:hypothetical protein
MSAAMLKNKNTLCREIIQCAKKNNFRAVMKSDELFGQSPSKDDEVWIISVDEDFRFSGRLFGPSIVLVGPKNVNILPYGKKINHKLAIERFFGVDTKDESCVVCYENPKNFSACTTCLSSICTPCCDKIKSNKKCPVCRSNLNF